jgi:molybdopterin synthase catalytic subunit/molybdopterin synthase sulfur carrier subunit
MAHLRLFASLREAAGRDSDEIEAGTVEELLEESQRRYGPEFGKVLAYSKVAVNGIQIDDLKGMGTRLEDRDEVALLPPVSGGR